MAYFPIFTDISKKKCIIVGGGKVACRKIRTLCQFDADILLISEQFCEEVTQLIRDNQFIHGKRGHAEEKDLEDAVLVVAATSSRQANHQIYEWCTEKKIPVNVIDAPEECSFLFPSIVKRKELCIGINTAGQSPIISAKVRREIEAAVPEYYAEIAEQLGRLKLYLKEHVTSEEERRRILKTTAAKAFELERKLTEDELWSLL